MATPTPTRHRRNLTAAMLLAPRFGLAGSISLALGAARRRRVR